MTGSSVAAARTPLERVLLDWSPAVLWALVIVNTSGDGFRASWTLEWIDFAMRLVRPDVAADVVETVNFVVRKLAHVTEYAIFAVLLARAFRSATGPLARAPLLAAVVTAALWSLGDEGRQSLSAVRTGSILDCATDTAGAALGAIGFRAFGGASAPRIPRTSRRRSPPCIPSPRP